MRLAIQNTGFILVGVLFFSSKMSVSPSIGLVDQGVLLDQGPFSSNIQESALGTDRSIYLPLVITPHKNIRRVNVPFFEVDIRYPETAIFWFGKVSPTENYADVRVGYDQDELYIRVAAFDRRLWYDIEPSPIDLINWDAVSLYLNLEGDTGEVPTASSYRFVAQLNWWQDRENWQASYRGDGAGWFIKPVEFTSSRGWRGNAPNDDEDDRGWKMTFRIPFESFGMSQPPLEGVKWGMAVSLHDRDDAVGTHISDKTWPETMDQNRPRTWGQLVFGLPEFNPEPANPVVAVTIRDSLHDAKVVDAHVGGHSNCGKKSAPDYFQAWGDANYAGYKQINIQNQADVADWPCFSKYYITFPLEVIPTDKIILSATLRMYQFGNAGQGADPGPQPSLIQVLTVGEGWNEETITWNNAPLAVENVSQTWVDPVVDFPGWPGIPWEWDVSAAVADSYAAGKALRLVLYEADMAYHSGKYFLSSDTEDWNAEGRPTLEVFWGE